VTSELTRPCFQSVGVACSRCAPVTHQVQGIGSCPLRAAIFRPGQFSLPQKNYQYHGCRSQKANRAVEQKAERYGRFAGKFPPCTKGKATVSASALKKIAAAQKARWAELRRANSTTPAVRPAAQATKNTMSPAPEKSSRPNSRPTGFKRNPDKSNLSTPSPCKGRRIRQSMAGASTQAEGRNSNTILRLQLATLCCGV
jgi:hypothetical protein